MGGGDIGKGGFAGRGEDASEDADQHGRCQQQGNALFVVRCFHVERSSLNNISVLRSCGELDPLPLH